MESHIKPLRLNGLPEAIRSEILRARAGHGWTQRELGKRAGLPQTHISAIETGKTVPRFDTFLDLVRVLDRDLVMIPRALVPVVQALVRDYSGNRKMSETDEGERSLYAGDDMDSPDEA